MARTIWKERSWLKRLPGPRGNRGGGVQRDHGLFPWRDFQEKLQQERNRAFRSHKPLVVMLLDAEKLAATARADQPGTITSSLSKAVTACLRESDISGLLREDVLIGVILTEVEAEKLGAAQLIVAGKVKGKLAELFGPELAERVAISFHLFPAIGENLAFEASPPLELIGARD